MIFFTIATKKISFKNISFSKYISKSHFMIKWFFTLLNMTLNNNLRKSLVRKTSRAVKERLVWGLSCLRSWLYMLQCMLSQVEVQSTCCCWVVFSGTRAQGSKALYSSCYKLCYLDNLAFYPLRWWESSSSGDPLNFYGALIPLAKKQRAEDWPV